MGDEPKKPDALLREPDAYEKAFMGPGESVVLRDKMSAHPVLHALMAIGVIAGVASVIATGQPILMAALPLLVGLLAWSSIATLRTTVSGENLHIQYGIIGPTIPIEDIQSAEPIDYSWVKYGGWGIRYSITDGSWCYNMVGDGGKAVEVHYVKNGKPKKVLVASKQNVLLADAINRARNGQLSAEFEDQVALDFDQVQDWDIHQSDSHAAAHISIGDADADLDSEAKHEVEDAIEHYDGS